MKLIYNLLCVTYVKALRMHAIRRRAARQVHLAAAGRAGAFRRPDGGRGRYARAAGGCVDDLSGAWHAVQPQQAMRLACCCVLLPRYIFNGDIADRGRISAVLLGIRGCFGRFEGCGKQFHSRFWMV